MFPIQQERQPRRKSRAIDENRKCLMCQRELEKEIRDLAEFHRCYRPPAVSEILQV